MADEIPRGRTRPLWWTLRAPARPLTYHAVHRMFERVNERAGTSATLHSLRHTAAYRMAEDPDLPLTDVQFVLGHSQLTTTQIYLAVYPDEAIQAHLAFLARRRALRPSEENRVPTDDEWTEFLGHFERRKVSTGTCGRAFGTPCIHEHACIRCSMLWPDPAQHERLVEIRDNLTARIAEAEREGWFGDVEGLQVSLDGANHKLAQIERRSPRPAAVDLGIPALTPRP
jgi:hypothetical protein